LINDSPPLTQGSLEAIDQTFRELGGDVLGIIPEQLDQTGDGSREDGLVRILISLRADARERKDWQTADQIRQKLTDLGITLEDRSDGTIWKVE
jgi:cysteinyl-tRNA synthetase